MQRKYQSKYNGSVLPHPDSPPIKARKNLMGCELTVSLFVITETETNVNIQLPTGDVKRKKSIHHKPPFFI